MDVRRLLEQMREGDFNDDVQWFLRGAAGRILRNLDRGAPPNADVELGLKGRRGRAQATDYHPLGVVQAVARLRLEGFKHSDARRMVGDRYGISTTMVRKIEDEMGGAALWLREVQKR